LPEDCVSMKMRKILLMAPAVLVLGLTVSSNLPETAHAAVASENASAKCRMPPFPEAYAGAKAVFTGKVISMTQNERGKTFAFRVEKYWKGSRSKKASVTVSETTRYQAFYESGKRYLVFAVADERGNLRDGRCSRSIAIADAGPDLKALGKAKIPR
jgi:hypothetical protein